MHPQEQWQGDAVNDIATLTATPRTVKLAGRNYSVRPLTLGDYGKLQAWLESQMPDTLGLVLSHCRDGVPVPLQKHMISEALQQASRPRIKLGSPEADAMLATMDGAKQMIRLGISRCDPTFDDAAAQALFEQASAEELAAAIQVMTADLAFSAGVDEDGNPKAKPPTGGG